MLKTGIKKELMFFTRSFKMGGIIIAAVGLAILYPFMMKLSGMMVNSLSYVDDFETGSNTSISKTASGGEVSSDNSNPDSLMAVFNDENLASLGIISSFSDITSTFLLVFMIITMSSAGGELKKRSMIIPRNAGLSTKLYVIPKFLVYPLAAALFSFVAMFLAGLVTNLLFSSYEVNFTNLILTSFIAAVYDAFMIILYFTLGLCMERAGIATIILYCGNTLFPLLLSSFGADKFQPFALKTEAQNLLMGIEADMMNVWGSMGVCLLLMVLCYLITVFVISAKKIDNRGGDEIAL